MYYFNVDNNGKLISWFDEELAKLETNNKDEAIKMDKELFSFFMSKSMCAFKNISDIDLKRVYTIEDVDLFEEIGIVCKEIDTDYISNEERINASLLLETAKKDISIKRLEENMANVLAVMSNREAK